jgi:hypothetical protein
VAKLIGVHQVPIDEVAGVLLAIQDVPAERRMNVVAAAINAWFAADMQGGTKCRDASEWKVA